MDIKSIINAIPKNHELRIWKRDNNTCWEIIDHSQIGYFGRPLIPTISAYGANDESLLVWVEQQS